ncbi:MAG TPA: hypothetical protein VIJ00_04445 [Nakamurella sp.]
MNELLKQPTRAQHPQCAVPGVEQIHCRVHDLPQRRVQVQPGRHRHHRLQQRVHPLPGAPDDRFRALLDSGEQHPVLRGGC